MGLLDGMLGNASKIDAGKIQTEFAQILASGERVEHAYQLIRDYFVFTDKRLVLVDKQGITGSKVEYHSRPYKSITHFSVETGRDVRSGCRTEDLDFRHGCIGAEAVQQKAQHLRGAVGSGRRCAEVSQHNWMASAGAVLTCRSCIVKSYAARRAGHGESRSARPGLQGSGMLTGLEGLQRWLQ